MFKNNLSHILSFLILFILPSAILAQDITLVRTLPSDSRIFVQGLEVNQKGQLLYSSGRYGESEVGYIPLDSNQRIVKDQLDADYFGEGLSITPYGIWQLSWHNQTAFLRDSETLKVKRVAHYLGEGWGLAYDVSRQQLWLSNGSDILQTFNPETFDKTGEIKVRYQEQAIFNINELEFANGFLYANIWQTNYIVKINPENGEVVQLYDFSPWVNELEKQFPIDTLNGIAHIEDNRFFITGKYYPVVWEMQLNK